MNLRDDFDVFGTDLNSEPLDNQDIKRARSDLTNKEDVGSVIEGMDITIQTAVATSGVKDMLINRTISLRTML